MGIEWDQTGLIVVAVTAMILGLAFKQGPAKAKPQWLEHLKGPKRLLGVVAFVGVLLIMMNPEFLLLGLVGDTAFLDMLVVALALQMHLYVTRAWQRCVSWITRGALCLGIPSPGLRYLLAISTLFVAGVTASLQKAFHRFTSWS